jgi:hypothetical protein
MKRSQAGFVMLAMLVVMALALVAAALCSSVALTGEAIAQDDIGADQATAVAQAGFDDALRRLAWGEVGESTTCLGQELPAPVDDSRSRCGAYDLRFDREPAGAAGTTERITVVGREGRARSTIVAEVALEPFGLPVGLAVDGDLEARTALTLAGCGAYAGGDVFGRQFVAFDQSAPGDGPGPTTGADNAHPEL